MSPSETFQMPALPEVGTVPETMIAQVVRQDRFGDPEEAFRIEELPVPELGEREVLIAVMAAGINYNNVWAARGDPDRRDRPAPARRPAPRLPRRRLRRSGIVYAVGPGVEGIAVGDEVIIHPGYWDRDDPWIVAGRDPMIAPSAHIWGYDTNFGAFAQFAKVQDHQVLPKAAHLTWEEAAAPTLVGTTAYRMLFGWEGNVLGREDVVLVWGGSGGLGTQAIQLVRHAGSIPVAVVSSAERGEDCVRLGAEGWIDRTDYGHWGVPPHWDDTAGQKEWSGEARRFGKALWEVVGSRRSPSIVFEHPGEDTVPTSIFLCEAGGMVVICAGTTGYSAMVDLRYHWVRQKRLQGSHGTNDEQATAYNDLVREGAIDPCLGQVLGFEEVGRAHADMDAGALPPGNTAILVNADAPGLGAR